MKRVAGLDIFRGYAIVLMVIFHFCFDLNYFHIVPINIRSESFWIYFRFCIVFMFIFSAGMSLQLAHYYTFSVQLLKKECYIFHWPLLWSLLEVICCFQKHGYFLAYSILYFLPQLPVCYFYEYQNLHCLQRF